MTEHLNLRGLGIGDISPVIRAGFEVWIWPDGDARTQTAAVVHQPPDERTIILGTTKLDLVCEPFLSASGGGLGLKLSLTTECSGIMLLCASQKDLLPITPLG